MNRSPRAFLMFFALTFILLRLAAALEVPPVVDEPQDLALQKQMPGAVSSFFSDVSYPDQARLPHLVSFPLSLLFPRHPLQAQRVLFLILHLLYLAVSYRLLKSVTLDRQAAGVYVLLMLTSSYIAGYSIFSNTTSGWLYLLLHLLCIERFWKAFSEQKKSGIFVGAVPLAVLLGACAASSLMGLLLGPSLAVFHLMRGGWKLKAAVPAARLLSWGLLFLALLVLISRWEAPGGLRTLSAFGMSLLYLFGIWRLFMRERAALSSGRPVAGALLWAAIGVTTGCFLVILSPIYLNAENWHRALEWMRLFRQGSIVENHRPFDGLRILALKFGWISSLCLLVPLFWALKKRLLRFGDGFYSLAAVVTLVHLAAVEASPFVVAHYFLPVFPFFYLLPVELLKGTRRDSIKLRVLAAALIAVLVADNQTRYFRWYPYSHWDGAQYGASETGAVNRAGMVSYEILPGAADWMQKEGLLNAGTRILLGPPSGPWSNMAFRYHTEIFEGILREKNIQGVRVLTEPGEADLVLLGNSGGSSPETARQIASGYEPLAKFSLKGIPIVTLWRNKRNAS